MGSYPVVMIHQVLANVSLSLLSGQVARDRYPLCFQAAKHPLHRRIIPAVASAAHALAHAVAPQSLAELTATILRSLIGVKQQPLGLSTLFVRHVQRPDD